MKEILFDKVVDCITSCVAVEWARAIYGSRPSLVRYTVPPALTVTDVLNPRMQVRARACLTRLIMESHALVEEIHWC